MPRTTLELDPTVIRELRRRGARERKSMGAIASELLARALRESEPSGDQPLRWITQDLGEPRVDLEDREALSSLLDSHG